MLQLEPGTLKLGVILGAVKITGLQLRACLTRAKPFFTNARGSEA